MNTLQTTMAVLSAFVTQERFLKNIEAHCWLTGCTFDTALLTEYFSGRSEPRDIKTLNAIASGYEASPSFVLSGNPNTNELWGFVEETRGVTAYLLMPVLELLVAYLCEYEPDMNGEAKSWSQYCERGFDVDHLNALDECLVVHGNTYPLFDIKFNNVVVGKALSSDKAMWISERLSRAVGRVNRS